MLHLQFTTAYILPTDPGAYIDYSHEKGDHTETWSMTLGNHGWSGGIYSIKEDVVAKQIYNLIKQKQIDSIRIDNGKIFSHYGKKTDELNEIQNDLLSKIHTPAST